MVSHSFGATGISNSPIANASNNKKLYFKKSQCYCYYYILSVGEQQYIYVNVYNSTKYNAIIHAIVLSVLVSQISTHNLAL